MEPYPIIDATDWPEVADEPQGGKQKIWLQHPRTEHHWLFKVRSQGGDDWAERVAMEVAKALGLPCAVVELARRGDQSGVLSLDFTDDRTQGDLVLGNDLLFETDPDYPASGSRYRVTAHTVGKVISVLSGIGVLSSAPQGMSSAADLFVGYLVLDAVIGNTDRHHENWGILRQPRAGEPLRAVLAPSFDHAASLGQILQDEERQRRLETKDIGYCVSTYVRKARSALYAASTERRPLSLMDAVACAGQQAPAALRYWREILAKIPPTFFTASVDRIPEHLASCWAKRFAIEMLHLNQRNLVEASLS